jgi:Xaa-Pro aminopeptidase
MSDTTKGGNQVELKLLEDPNLDKVEEYFKAKDSIRILRRDLKDLKDQMPEMQELEKLMKKVKELREIIKDNEDIKAIQEKVQTTKERQDLLLELIRIDMLERGQDEIKRNGRKLKIVNKLRELKDESDQKPKKFFRK